jgi:hypothetical protein
MTDDTHNTELIKASFQKKDFLSKDTRLYTMPLKPVTLPLMSKCRVVAAPIAKPPMSA